MVAPDANTTSSAALPPARMPRWSLVLLALMAAATAFAGYRMSEATGQLTATERERVSLMQEKSRLDTALAAARKQVDELKSGHAAAEAEIKKSREDAKAASTQSVQFQERAKALETEVEKMRQEAAGAAKARGDLEARAVGVERDMATRLNEMQQRLDEALRNLKAAVDAKDKAEQQLRQANQPGAAPQAQPQAPQAQPQSQPAPTAQPPVQGVTPMRL